MIPKRAEDDMEVEIHFDHSEENLKWNGKSQLGDFLISY